MKVPFKNKNEIERESEILIASYEKKYGETDSLSTPVDAIAEHHLGIIINVSEMQEDILGCIDVRTKEISINHTLDPVTNKSMEGRYNFTLGHEIGHFILHKDLVAPTMPTLFDNVMTKSHNILCRKSEYKEPIEWQADYFASCLLMPKKKTLNLLSDKYGKGNTLNTAKLINIVNSDASMKIEVMKQRNKLDRDSILEWWATSLAKDFKVSPPAMVIRLKNLGFITESEHQKTFAA